MVSIAPVTTEDSAFAQLGSGQPRETMLMPEGLAANGAILVWVPCAASGAVVKSWPKLLPMSMSGSPWS